MGRYEVKDYYDRTVWIEVERSPARQAMLSLFGYAAQATQRESNRHATNEPEEQHQEDTSYPWFPYEEGTYPSNLDHYDPRTKDHLS